MGRCRRRAAAALLTLLAFGGSSSAAAGAASTTTTASVSPSPSSTTSTPSTSSTSLTSSISSASTLSTSTTGRSTALATFKTVVGAFPTGDITTKLPGPAVTGVPIFVPLENGDLVSEQLSYVVNLDSEELTVGCWYPISGNYGVLPRILFYVTIIAALLLRHHQWLYAGALVASLTYSGSAAIQACFMVWIGNSYGDLDMVPLLTVLGVSCILTVPLLNWSDTLRNMGRNRNEGLEGTSDCKNNHHGERRESEFARASRTILLYWGFLVVLGFLCTFVAMVPQSFNPDRTYGWTQLTNGLASSVICTPPNGQFNYTAGESSFFTGVVISQEFIDANNCQNPCSQPVGSVATFRSAGDLQPLSRQQISRSFFQFEVDKVERHNDAFTDYYYQFGLLIFPYILLQGFYAALFGRRTPGQARNVLYSVLTRLRLTKARSPLDPAQAWQRSVAKWIALSGYAWAILIFILAIPVVICTVVAGEIFMFNLAESEDPRHAGQWMAWTNVALVIFAAFMARFHQDILYVVSLSAYKAAWLIAHPSWPFAMIGGSRGNGHDSNVTARNIFTGEMEEMPDRHLYRATAGSVLGKSSIVWEVVSHKITASWEGFVGEMRQTAAFIHDPEESRRNQGRTRRLYAGICQCTSSCSCPSTVVQGACRHEEHNCPRARQRYEECPHDPACQHTRTCEKTRMRRKRLSALHPERKTISMALGAVQNMIGYQEGVLQLDVTKTPIRVRGKGLTDPTLPFPQRYDHGEGSESDIDEKMASPGPTAQPWQGKQHLSSASTARHGSLRRFFSRNGNHHESTQYQPSPLSQSLYDSGEAQSPQPERGESSQAAQDRNKRGVRVTEGPIHPLRQDSIVSEESAEYEDHGRRPSEQLLLQRYAEESRRRSMLKSLPTTPKYTPRTPLPTPNYDTRSMASGVSALSPVVATDIPVNLRQDDVSPDLSSAPLSKLATGEPSPIHGEPSPNEEDYDAQARASGGLTTSFERGIMSRHRRSQVYGGDIIRERSMAARSDTAPIPVHLEVPTDDEATDADVETSAPDFAIRPPTAETGAAAVNVGTPNENDAVAANEDEATEPPARMRHIADLLVKPGQLMKPEQAFFLTGPRESSGTFLSAQEKHQLLDSHSGASTPPIQLPPLSPADPASNTARAGHLALLNRSPHLSLGSIMHSPHRQSLASVSNLAASVSTAGLSVPPAGGSGGASGAAAAAAVAAGPTSAPREAPILEGLKRIEDSIQRKRSPRPPGYRSTVDYLQVHRPTTMVYADEIVLRKDEFGQYRLVMNGDQYYDMGGGSEITEEPNEEVEDATNE